MLKVPSVFHIDDITEKIIKEKAAPTGETAVINYRDWKTIQLGYLVNISNFMELWLSQRFATL